MTGQALPQLSYNQIIQSYPDGCFVFMFEWDVSTVRCRRNLLPTFVKTIEVLFPGTNTPVKGSVLYKHRLNGTPTYSSIPYASYYVATTEDEAKKEYLRLVEQRAARREQYVLDLIDSSQEYIKTLKTKASNHKLK